MKLHLRAVHGGHGAGGRRATPPTRAPTRDRPQPPPPADPVKRAPIVSRGPWTSNTHPLAIVTGCASRPSRVPATASILQRMIVTGRVAHHPTQLPPTVADRDRDPARAPSFQQRLARPLAALRGAQHPRQPTPRPPAPACPASGGLVAIGDRRGGAGRALSRELRAGCTLALLSSGACVSSAVSQPPLATAGPGIAVALLRQPRSSGSPKWSARAAAAICAPASMLNPRRIVASAIQPKWLICHSPCSH
jgi:hypothetical protein